MSIATALARRQRRKVERRLSTASKKGRMKHIKYEQEFLNAVGQVFYIPNPDVEIQKAARDQAIKDQKAVFNAPQVKATFATAMIWFTDNIPHERDEKGQPARKLSMQDAGHAYAVIKGFQGHQNGTVELEDTVYDWLVELVKTDGPVAFHGATAALVKERIEDTVPDPKKAKAKEE